MPVFTIDAPLGAQPEAKRRMLQEVHEALDEAFHFPDTRGWLREYPSENIAQDGRVQAEPARPVCNLEVPDLVDLNVKRTLTRRIGAAIDAAYVGLANTEEVLVFFNHYPLEDVGWRQSLQSDKPEIVAAIGQLNAAVRA